MRPPRSAQPSSVSRQLWRSLSCAASSSSLTLTLEARKRTETLAETVEAINALFALTGARKRPTVSVDALLRFSVAARMESIRGASRRLGIGQPQLTRQLSKLERQLGRRLLDRSRRGIVCSEYGRAALPLADTIVRNWDSLSHASTERFRREIATWRFGSVTPLGHESSIAAMLGSLTAAWGRKYPNHPLALSGGTADELMVGLKSRRFDAVLLDHGRFPSEFDGRIVYAAELALVGHESLMASVASDVATLLLSHPLALLSAKSGIGQEAALFLEQALGERDRSRLRIVEVDSAPVIVNLVARHGHLTILPAKAMMRLPFRLAARPLDCRREQVISVIWRRGALPHTVAEDMVSMLMDGAEKVDDAPWLNVQP